MLKIVHYPHPTLRHPSQPVLRINRRLQEVVAEMFQRMYEAEGIGLAANQVDLPLRLFVVNVAGKRDEGEELVFINPVLSRPKGEEEREEGCLSLPGLYAPVVRPERVTLSAYNLLGEEIHSDLSGILARVVQHETDHLDGVLFVDRLSLDASAKVQESLLTLEAQFHEDQRQGHYPSDREIADRRHAWEQEFCGS